MWLCIKKKGSHRYDPPFNENNSTTAEKHLPRSDEGSKICFCTNPRGLCEKNKGAMPRPLAV